MRLKEVSHRPLHWGDLKGEGANLSFFFSLKLKYLNISVKGVTSYKQNILYLNLPDGR